MDTLLFLKRLKSLRFDSVALKRKGFDKEYVSDILRAFSPKKEDKESESTNSLIKFVEEYETEFSLISNISLNGKVEYSGKYVLFGWLRGEDPLAINTKTNEVVSFANWDYNTIIFYCAENSTKFMEAFLVHGVGNLDIEFKTDEMRWTSNLDKAKMAAKVAGGDKYYKFWESLYPTDDGKVENPNDYGFLN